MRVTSLVLLMMTMSLAMFVMVVATGGWVLQSAAIAMLMDPLRLAATAAPDDRVCRLDDLGD